MGYVYGHSATELPAGVGEYDLDGDGYLTREEFKPDLAAVGDEMHDDARARLAAPRAIPRANYESTMATKTPKRPKRTARAY